MCGQPGLKLAQFVGRSDEQHVDSIHASAHSVRGRKLHQNRSHDHADHVRCAYQQNPAAFWKLYDAIYDGQELISASNAYGKMTDLKAEFDQTAFNKSLNQSIPAKGTVYLYFNTKEEILANLLLEGLDTLSRYLAAAFDETVGCGGEAQCRLASMLIPRTARCWFASWTKTSSIESGARASVRSVSITLLFRAFTPNWPARD